MRRFLTLISYHFAPSRRVGTPCALRTAAICALLWPSAINAATLKPTQCALWLRPPVPPGERNVLYRGFNYGYDACERWYTRLIARMADL